MIVEVLVTSTIRSMLLESEISNPGMNCKARLLPLAEEVEGGQEGEGSAEEGGSEPKRGCICRAVAGRVCTDMETLRSEKKDLGWPSSSKGLGADCVGVERLH